MKQATTNTFDINEYKDRWDDPASYSQLKGLANKFAKTAKGKINWQYQSQIKACLYSEVKAGKLTPKEAKEKQTALRKRMVLQRFDKNKDGKLCEKEQAAMKKALAERKNKDTRRGSKPRRERGEGPRRGGDKRKRPTRK